MFYKKDGAIGIREKFGDKRQIFSFGRTSKSTEAALRPIADTVLNKLDTGVSAANAKKWADSQVSKLADLD